VIDSYQTARQPRAFNIDPSGRYLLSIGALSDSMTLHSIDHASGKLTVLREYPMEKKPDWVAIVQLP
jgi:6-phosphogluconolactonase